MLDASLEKLNKIIEPGEMRCPMCDGEGWIGNLVGARKRCIACDGKKTIKR